MVLDFSFYFLDLDLDRIRILTNVNPLNSGSQYRHSCSLYCGVGQSRQPKKPAENRKSRHSNKVDIFCW